MGKEDKQTITKYQQHMKKGLVTIMMLTVCMGIAADGYTYLTFEGNDGTFSMAANGLTITFDNDKLTVVNGNESHTFQLSSLSKMYFSGTTGISSAETVDSAVEVYSTAGVRIGKFTSLTDAKSQLTKGVYIVKTNNKTFKFAVK